MVDFVKKTEVRRFPPHTENGPEGKHLVTKIGKNPCVVENKKTFFWHRKCGVGLKADDSLHYVQKPL
jgi:hypothetical protein